jgi:hypothetical protein
MAGSKVSVGIKKSTVAVGEGVVVGEFAGLGVRVGVTVGGNAVRVCPCATAAVCAIAVLTLPGAGEGREGGAMKGCGAQPAINTTITSKLQIWPDVDLRIAPPFSRVLLTA